MLFNSYEFIFAFLPITFIVYFWLNSTGKQEIGKMFLVGASLSFYSWWNVLNLPLIVGSIIFNFLIGRQLLFKTDDSETVSPSHRYLLIFGVVSNLSLLGYFKYADFLTENTNHLTGSGFRYRVWS